MNEFDKRMNALRLQFSAERDQIAKDTYRKIGHINNAIGQTEFPEVRDALRAEKSRLKEAMREAHRINRECYLGQIEAIENESKRHYKNNLSNTQIRRMMAALFDAAEAQGQRSVTITFGENQQAVITFD